MAKKSKRYTSLKDKFGSDIKTIDEAFLLIKENSSKKFDESIEVHIKLGIDPKQSNQIVRGSTILPHGTGKKIKIAVFTETKEKDAKSAGADIVGGKDLVEDVLKTKKTDFDVAIATPDFMRELAKIAKILGTRGLMPSPKNGTVTNEIEHIVSKIKSGQVNFRNDASGNVHQVIGKASWDVEKLKENFNAFLKEVRKLKPKGIKGSYIRSIVICSTISPGIKVSI